VKRPRLLACLSSFLKAKPSAFTMIELLLVVALLVVVAGLSIPNLSKQFSSIGLDQAAKHISYLMRYAQSMAIVHQKEYRLYFSSDRLQYWLEQELLPEEKDTVQEFSEQNRGFQKMTKEQGKVFSLPLGISLEMEKEFISFYPDGTIDRIKMALDNKDQKKMIISTQERRGQVDVFSPTH
jgi:prepilin-type N-terminal cleavage/methylation domain-containing protein